MDPTTATETDLQAVDLHPALILDKVETWANAGFRILPNLAVALALVMVFWFAAKYIGKGIRRGAAVRDRTNLGDVLGSFVHWSLFVLGCMVALTVVLPNLHPADLISGLGIGSVAIGFAFKDILQNWLAGVLLLLRRPFHIGDMIKVDGYEGTVERIESRATLIRTYDGQRVIIPNSQLYTESVTVITAYENRRTEMDFGIGYDDDIDQAVQIITDTIAGIDGVESDPGVQALPWSLDASWVTIRARWWVKSDGPVIGTRVKALTSVKKALEAAGIDIPFNIQTQLFRDETPVETIRARADMLEAKRDDAPRRAAG